MADAPQNRSPAADPTAGFSGWTATVVALAALMAGAIALLVFSAGRGDKAATRQDTAGRLGVVQAEAVHRELAIAASRLQPPSLLPVATEAQAAPHDAPRPVEAAPALPPVPPESQVSLVLTSSAIGELDPCG
jgi:hypothetical protein